MQVAMYYNNNDVRIQEMPKPQISDGEFLLKMKACGICGSDIMEWYRIKKAPLVLGHEACGEIVEAKGDTKSFKVGDRVFVSHHVPCNSCRYCLGDNHTACDTLRTTNFFPGGFSEYIRVPAINVDRGTFSLGENVSYEQGTFIEPLGCIIRGQRIAGLEADQHVLILGAGISGLLHLLLAKAKEAGRIFVTDIDEFRLKKAAQLGADLAISAKEDVPAYLKRVNNGRLADLVIICTSSFSAFKQALLSVDRGGTILCFAPTEPGIELPIPVNDFWRNGIKIVHSYGSSPQDLALALELLQRKVISIEDMITHRLDLSQASQGFKLFAQGKEALKVILTSNG